ncbi:3-deoxy-D-manno-octulosonic acid transferase [Salipiger bermudensis]|uniref:3-deoxy-D-manno-octulosonic acid transferase n=1 Tax=Salipiger bermudensis TaxID=344736 RepID=UPI001C990818|nr:glycosyltransferase N-terminal domain-containing protein [Salipiger bermudensis]MBY6002629.1 3-deoxy-D-manno-octulosonic acid transferase [Salipiger bermudensis]
MLLYRLIVSIFAAVVLARLALLRDWAALRQRLARSPARPGPHLWLHAASNGELASAKPLITALQEARPDLALLVTCNSEGGVALAESWGLPARLAPLDLARVARRMHRDWNVRAHITLESELWPNRVRTCPGPVFVIGGRLSEGTAKGWRLFDGLLPRVLGRLRYVSAQDAGSLGRYRAAGLPEAAAGPVLNLKEFYAPDPRRDATLAAAFDRAQTWLAASTHEGEEETVLAAHKLARAQEPTLRLILAPRHPRRGDAVEQLILEAGLSCARRSRGEAAEGAEVYLADTLGEMGLLYPLAGRLFIGGTLTDRGGHTPFEPAAYATALLHGPDVANHAAPFARLSAARAAIEVADAPALAEALNRLAARDAQEALGQAAQETLRPETDLEELVAAITQRLDPPG